MDVQFVWTLVVNNCKAHSESSRKMFSTFVSSIRGQYFALIV